MNNTTRTDGFTPRWSSAPGATVADALTERGVRTEEFSHELGWTTEQFEAFVSGDIAINEGTASLLSELVGADPEFWLEREAQYRRDRANVAADTWAQRLPLKYLADQRQIDHHADWVAIAHDCLELFGVSSVDEWSGQYGRLLENVRLRASNGASIDPGAILVWLRIATSSEPEFEPMLWNPEHFQNSLERVRGLTKDPDPTSFGPKLQAICAEAGVQLTILKAPPGCPVSGAAFKDAHDQRHIVLSGRYLSDDHFWYTFFHEAGHLLIHDASEPFLDELDQHENISNNELAEKEADEFATTTIAPGLDAYHLRDGNFRGVVRAASAIGVAPGIVLGMAQHRGDIPYGRMNRLKRRYEWLGTNLESKRKS